MSRPGPSDSTLDTAIELLKGGITLSEVAGLVGFTRNTLTKYLRERRNFSIRETIHRPAHNAKYLDQKELVRLYLSGSSPNQLARQFGTSRPTIVKNLMEQGVQLRNQRDAGLLEWSKLSPEERFKQTEAAHAARTGQTATLSEKLKRSASQGTPKGIFEQELFDILIHKGREVIAQAPLGIYNLDLLVGGRVAVELGTGPINRYRTEYGLARLKEIADAGLSFMYVCVRSVDAAIACSDQIVSDLDHLCSLPTGTRENRVVRCATYNFTRFRNERGQMAAVPTPPEHKYIIVNCDWLI